MNIETKTLLLTIVLTLSLSSCYHGRRVRVSVNPAAAVAVGAKLGEMSKGDSSSNEQNNTSSFSNLWGLL